MHATGSLIAGKYRITRQLGAGGMGAVFKAENVAIGRTVAVKLLHPHLADDEVSLARFQREARTAASVAHRHLIEVLDLGVEASGTPFLVMEYVRGRSLADALRSDGAFGVRRALHVAGQVLAALATVHEQGIVHRDLKPENILLTTRDGRPDFVKVLDFGVAALADGADRAIRAKDLTPSGRVMGSPHYTSPEQIRGRASRDPRVDLWSVGVLLYQMLTGIRPFAAPKLDALCQQILKDDPAPFAEQGASVPAELEAIVRRALEKEPERRFESAAAMLEALVPFGAEPLSDDEPEPTDTFTFDLRALRERELAVLERDRRSEPPLAQEGLSGRFTIATREVLKSRIHPDVLSQAIGAVKPEVHARFVGPMEAEGWYSDAWLDLLEKLDERVGRGDRRLLAEVGREVVRVAEPSLFVGADPALTFGKLPSTWAALFRSGRASVEVCSRGHGRLRIEDQPDARLARSIAFLGLVEEALRRSRGQRVDARLAKSIVLGDPYDLVEASWSDA